MQDEGDIFFPVILKKEDQIEEASLIGKALDSGNVEHVGKAGIPDLKDLLFDFCVHLTHQLSGPGPHRSLR